MNDSKNGRNTAEKIPSARESLFTKIIAIVVASIIILAAGRAGGIFLMRAVTGTGAPMFRPRAEEGAVYVGDEAAAEAEGIPAPPASELLFVGKTGGSPPGMSYRYVSDVAIESVVEYYRYEMPRRGWRELKNYSDKYTANYEGVALVFTRRGGRQMMIWISPGEFEGPTMITLMMR